MHLLQNTVKLVQTWMATCIGEHPLCSQKSSYAPNRLLGLGGAFEMALTKLSYDTNSTAGYVLLGADL